MNSITRVFAAFGGQPADRRAFALTLSLYGARLTNCPLNSYYADPASYLAGQRAVTELCDPDILFTPFVIPLEARAFGCELTASKNGPPNVKKPACKGLTDVDRLILPLIDADPGLTYLVESTKLLAREFGNEKPIAAVLTSPIDMPALLVGIDAWLEALLFQPEACLRLTTLAVSHFQNLAAAMLQAGASCVITPVMFANPRIVTPDIARQVATPVLTQAYGSLKGPVIFHHGGNRLAPFLDMFMSVPNVAGFALDQRDSFAQAREVIGTQPVLFGNLSGPHLAGMTADEASARTTAILDDRAHDPSFIFCTANADIPWNTRPETIVAIRDAIINHEPGRPA